MKTFFNNKMLEIPTPENFETKEVYAFFGLCSYCSQVLERGLANLTIVLNINNGTKITKEIIEDIIQKEDNRKATLYTLIHDIKKLIYIDQEIECKLNSALKSRNYLIHHFFYNHSSDFLNSNGRKKMINELSNMILLFHEVDRRIDTISNPLFMKMGVTKEMIEKNLENIHCKSNE